MLALILAVLLAYIKINKFEIDLTVIISYADNYVCSNIEKFLGSHAGCYNDHFISS